MAEKLDLAFIYAGVVEHNVPALGLAGYEEGYTIAAIPAHVSELTNRNNAPEGEATSLAQLPMVLAISPEKLPRLSEIPGIDILSAKKQHVIEKLKEWKNQAIESNPSGKTAPSSERNWAEGHGKRDTGSGPPSR